MANMRPGTLVFISDYVMEGCAKTSFGNIRFRVNCSHLYTKGLIFSLFPKKKSANATLALLPEMEKELRKFVQDNFKFASETAGKEKRYRFGLKILRDIKSPQGRAKEI
jgi:hypothetical protein